MLWLSKLEVGWGFSHNRLQGPTPLNICLLARLYTWPSRHVFCKIHGVGPLLGDSYSRFEFIAKLADVDWLALRVEQPGHINSPEENGFGCLKPIGSDQACAGLEASGKMNIRWLEANHERNAS